MALCRGTNWFSPYPIIIAVLLILNCGILFAQDDTDDGPKSADEIAKELSNPVGTLANFTFQGTYTVWNGELPGAGDQNTSTLVFMPTLPFKLWGGNLSVRPSFPVSNSPVLNEQGEWSDERGFGNIGLMTLWGKATESGLLYGVGPTMFFPTRSDPALGSNQFQLGPAAMIGLLRDWGVIGGLWQHYFGLGSLDQGEDRVNLGTLQVFYWFSLGNGWQIGGSPLESATYVNGQDIDFSLPINLGIAKTVVLGKMPLKFTVQGQYFVTRPDLVGPSWGIFFQITPVIKVPWG